MCQILLCKILQPFCLLKLASLISFYSLYVYYLRLLFMRLCYRLLFSQPYINNVYYLIGSRQRAIINYYINNKVLLQPTSLKEYLYLNFLEKYTLTFFLEQPIFFLIILPQPVNINYNKAVVNLSILKSIKRLPQLLDQQSQQQGQFNFFRLLNLLVLIVLYNPLPLFAYYGIIIMQIHIQILYASSILPVDKHLILPKILKALSNIPQ